MCLAHWRRVPHDLQRAVWATYREGQEITKTPSREYVHAAEAAIAAIAAKEGRVPARSGSGEVGA